jgi:hypothetical protein
MKKILFTLFICTLLAACAGGGIRYSIIETNAGSNIFDRTARFSGPLDPEGGARRLERNIPNEPFAKNTNTMISYIQSIGGECSGSVRMVCIINRREVSEGGTEKNMSKGISYWLIRIAWRDNGGIVHPKVFLNFRSQRLD